MSGSGREPASCEACTSSACSARTRREGESAEQYEERQALARRLCAIEHKILVLSGKGGVGKTTVAVNLAVWLVSRGKRVGLLDVDIHGPSVPTMLGVEGAPIRGTEDGMIPVRTAGLEIMSIGFLLRHRDDAVIWRGPRKMGAIKQFLKDVAWGSLDFLVVDLPPGTGDEPLSVCQLLEGADGAVVVTTPQEVSLGAVRRSIGFCRQLGMPVLGVIENMSGCVCPKCGERFDIFPPGGGERMARDGAVPFLGRIPIEPSLSLACDEGVPYLERFPGSETAKAFGRVFRRLGTVTESPNTATS